MRRRCANPVITSPAAKARRAKVSSSTSDAPVKASGPPAELSAGVPVPLAALVEAKVAGLDAVPVPPSDDVPPPPDVPPPGEVPPPGVVPVPVVTTLGQDAAAVPLTAPSIPQSVTGTLPPVPMGSPVLALPSQTLVAVPSRAAATEQTVAGATTVAGPVWVAAT